MGVIPEFIRIWIKGKSLSRVIGPWRLPITRWVGEVQRQKDPTHGVMLDAQLGTSLNPHLRV